MDVKASDTKEGPPPDGHEEHADSSCCEPQLSFKGRSPTIGSTSSTLFGSISDLENKRETWLKDTPLPDQASVLHSEAQNREKFTYDTMNGKGREKSCHSSGAVPVRPYHVFSMRQKWFVVVTIGAAGLFSGLSSNIYFPALETIAQVRRLRRSTVVDNLLIPKRTRT